MAEAQSIMDSVTGAGAVAVLQRDLAERAEELLPKLLEQIEATAGWVPQSVTLGVKFKPGDEEKPATFEIMGKLACASNVTVRASKVAGSGKNGTGPMQLTLFTKDD